MSPGNPKADDGSELVVPVTTLYHESARRAEAEGELADAIRRAEVAERRLRELQQLIAREQPDSPLGRRCALTLQLRAAGLR